MKKLMAVALAAFPLLLGAESKPVTLDWCQDAARSNYPLVRQYGLIAEAERYSVNAALAGYLPRLSASGKATDQSDVTSIALTIPGVSIPSTSTDQYQIAGEISETLWDGNLSLSQRSIAKASADADRKKIEVDLYGLRDRVNQIFFAMLLFDSQLAQNDLLMEELDTNLRRVQAYVDNGVAMRSDLDAIRLEKLTAAQNRTALLSARKSYRAMLERIVGVKFDGEAIFEKPAELSARPAPGTATGGSAESLRPEFALFAARTDLLSAQKKLALAGVQPRVSAFFQVGYGKPALNMLSDDPDSFWVGGIRFSWQLDGFYTVRDSLGKIDADIAGVKVQSDLFSYNQDLSSEQQRNEIEKLRTMLEGDDEIIALRSSIKATAEKRVENGTLSVGDLLREINAESLARQTKSLREVQLLAAEYNLAFTNND
jgi:outer membrane protein TolC